MQGVNARGSNGGNVEKFEWLKTRICPNRDEQPWPKSLCFEARGESPPPRPPTDDARPYIRRPRSNSFCLRGCNAESNTQVGSRCGAKTPPSEETSGCSGQPGRPCRCRGAVAVRSAGWA